MGPRPKPPPPLGVAPKTGFEHPKFPTIGKLDPTPPKGGYASNISTRPPLDMAQVARISSVPVAFRAAGNSAGDLSRAAFARSLQDTTQNELRRAADKFNVETQTQAEKSRAEDVLAQRQNTSDTFRLETLRDVFNTDVLTGFDQKQKDLAAYYERERKNSQAMITAAFMRMLGGLI